MHSVQHTLETERRVYVAREEVGREREEKVMSDGVRMKMSDDDTLRYNATINNTHHMSKSYRPLGACGIGDDRYNAKGLSIWCLDGCR